jgi:HEAT repeat protein
MIDDKIKDISNKIANKTFGSDDDESDELDDDVVERGSGDLRTRLRETGGEIRVEKSQVPDLVDFLSSERVEDRVNASRALVEVAQHYPEEVDEHLHAVINLLDDEDNKVRKHACITLGVIGSEDAIDDLEAVMDGADEEVKIAAEKAIRHIRKQHSGEVEAVTEGAEETESEEPASAESTDDDRPDWAGGSGSADEEDAESGQVDAEPEAEVSEPAEEAEETDEITADEDRPAWAGGTADEEDEEDETAEAPEADDGGEEDQETVEQTDGDEEEQEIAAASTVDEADDGGEEHKATDDETDEIKEVPAGETAMDDTTDDAASDETSPGSADRDAIDREIDESIEEAIQDLDRPISELPRLVLLWLLAEGDESTREDVGDAIHDIVAEYPEAVSDSASEFVEAAEREREDVSRFASQVVDAITEQQPEALEDEIPYLMDSVRSADEEIRQRAKDALTKIAERSPDKVVDEIAERDD